MIKVLHILWTLAAGLLLVLQVQAQTQPLRPLARELAARKATATPATFTLFHTMEAGRISGDFSQYVRDAAFACSDEEVIRALMSARPDILHLPVEVHGQQIVLDLYRAEIFSDNYRLRTQQREYQSAAEDMLFYRGIVQGDSHSLAAVSIVRGEVRVLYSTRAGNIRMHRTESDQYVIYTDTDVRQTQAYSCDVSDEHIVGSSLPGTQSRAVQTGDCVEIYFECDYKSYQDNGSSVPATEAWVAALFNEVATLYENEDIPVGISDIMVWTTTDPYAGLNSTGAVLTEFVNQINTNGYDGRLAHLLSTRNLGGGIAYVDVLCSQSVPCGVSASLSTTIIPFPNYSWNVMVVAHELGHNFGSQHTHKCVWNGNSTQIDDCGSVYGDVQSCYDEDNPILPEDGTIMSYCHTIQGVGINFTLGFGPLPGNLIRNRFLNATCNTGTCAPPPCTQLTAPQHQATQVDILSPVSWAPVNGANGYRITIGTAPGTGNIVNDLDVDNVTTYTPVNTFPFNATIYVKVVPYNIIGSSTGCVEEYFTTEPDIAPLCTQLNSPLDGAINVPIDTDLSWAHSIGNQAGYKITLGTAPGIGDILNLFNVGNVTMYSPDALPSNTELYVRITPYWENGDITGCAEESFTTQDFVYCTSQGTNSDDEWIAGVSLGSFSNTSGAQGYTDFSHLVAHVSAGGAYPVSITAGYAGQVFNEYFRVWIDLNHDGVFQNPGERVFQAGNVSGTATGTITIPAASYIGVTRMRVAMRYGNYSTPCQTFTWGEVEDYSVHIHCNLVTNTNDQGAGSLPWAIGCASAGETIGFASSLNNATIQFNNHYATIGTPLSIVANTNQNIQVSGASTPYVFVIDPGIAATMSGLRVIAGTAAEGSAILNHGILTLHNSEIRAHHGIPDSKLLRNTGTLMIEGSFLIEQ